MKFSKISGLTSLLLAASAEAAPQYVADSGPDNIGGPAGISLEQAVNRVFAADKVDPVRRDAPSLEEAVDQIFAAQHANLRRDGSSVTDPHRQKVWDTFLDNPADLTQEFGYHTARYACIKGGKKVYPGWAWEQTESKIDYMFQPEAMSTSISRVFPNAKGGMDWNARQDGSDNTWIGDWVTFQLSYNHLGGDKPMNVRLAKNIIMAGLGKCTITFDGKTDTRTEGFAVRYAEQWDFLLNVVKIDNKVAEKFAGGHKDAKFQNPVQVGWDVWDKWIQVNNTATPYGSPIPEGHDELKL